MSVRIPFARLGVVAVLSGWGVGGCTYSGRFAADPLDPNSLGATAQLKQEQGGVKPETLTAVEEFLARTQEYRLESATKPSAPSNADSRADASAAVIQAAPLNGGAARTQTQGPSPALNDSGRIRDAAFANTQVAILESPDTATPVPIPAVESVNILWKDPKTTGPDSSVKSNAINAPLDMQVAGDPDSLERMIPVLQRQLEDQKDFSTEWRLRLLQLALDRDSDAANLSPFLAEESRVLLESLIGAVAAVRNRIRNPMLTGAEAVRQVDVLRQSLSRWADPVVSEVTLCRKVVTFGSYEEMESEEFVAGRSIQTIVYSEIGNLSSEGTSEGSYLSRISTRIEALTADGQSVWMREEPEIVDQCRRRRTDFFVAQRITLPPTMPAGEYVLKVMVEDKLSGKLGEASRPFTIHSPVSVANGARSGG